MEQEGTVILSLRLVCVAKLEIGFIGFYGIPIIVGYLMLNPLYTYILNI